MKYVRDLFAAIVASALLGICATLGHVVEAIQGACRLVLEGTSRGHCLGEGSPDSAPAGARQPSCREPRHSGCEHPLKSSMPNSDEQGVTSAETRGSGPSREP